MSVTYPAPVYTIYVPPAKRDCPFPHLPCPHVDEAYRAFMDSAMRQLTTYFVGHRDEDHDGRDKKPHKCPLCEGSGTLPAGIDLAATHKPCHACNGTGIVWG